MPAAIRTTQLCKTYKGAAGPVHAVAGLDLEIGTGEFFGLLGPNGAGKSTTIGMLTTRIQPTGGSAYVCGFDVAKRPVTVKNIIGVVTQRNTMDRQINIRDNLEFRGRYFGMSARDARRRAMELLERFDLAERAEDNDDFLSGGQSRRAMIARALMHRPKVLILDEPTAGIDPQTRVNLWDALRELHSEGQTIVLTSHYLEEVEALCGRIAVVDHGKVLACETADGLKATAGSDAVITLVFDGPADGVSEMVGKLDGVRRVEAEGSRLRVYAAPPAEGLLGEIIGAGVAQGLAVRDASTLQPSLETAFLTLTGREYRE
jgi:ABC-2 type transport system ATP-binding protein